MIVAEGQEIDTMVGGAERNFEEDAPHLHDVTTTAEDRILIVGIEAIMTPSAGSDRGHLTATDDRIPTVTEALVPTDVAVRSLQEISLTFLGATVTTSLMFRFL